MSLLASAASLQTSQTSYDGSSPKARLPFQTEWGSYRIQLDHIRDYARVRIVDQAGLVRKEIRATTIMHVDYVTLHRGNLPVLRVVVDAGGVAESNERTYLFSAEHGLRNILVLTGEVTKVKDLNHDGHAELIANSSVPLEYFTDFDHYGCGDVGFILGWNGNRYVLKNRQYSGVVRQHAKDARRELLNSTNSARRDALQVGAAICMSANLWTIGEGKEYFPWIRKHLTRAGWRWFLQAQPELRQRMIDARTIATINQKHLIVFNYG